MSKKAEAAAMLGGALGVALSEPAYAIRGGEGGVFLQPAVTVAIGVWNSRWLHWEG